MLWLSLRRPSACCACARSRRTSTGFTLIELMVAVGVLTIMAAAAVPVVQSTVAFMQLQAAATSVVGAIQGTRYQAISCGYKYQVAFTSSSGSYQLLNDPTSSGTFTNVGVAVPFVSSSASVTLAANTTVQLSPSGSVSFITGSSPLVLTYKGKTATITVSNYGSVHVTYT